MTLPLEIPTATTETVTQPEETVVQKVGATIQAEKPLPDPVESSTHTMEKHLDHKNEKPPASPFETL